MNCEFMDNCIFFNDRMGNSPGVGVVFKKMYCRGNNRNCARYMIAKRLGASSIPALLYPNNRAAALDMITRQPTA